jgi:hypothetical protein
LTLGRERRPMRRMRTLGIILIVGLAAALAYCWLWPRCRPAPPPAAPIAFALHEQPGAPVTGFRGINSAGDIVGYYQDTAVESTAHALLMRGGRLSTIDPPSTNDRRAFGINDSGLIALTFDGRNTVLWDGTAYTPVLYPDATGTVVRALNNTGDVGGEFTDAADAVRAFIRIGGTFTPIDFTDAVRSSVRGINDAGAAVGYYELASRVRRCYMRAPDGTITELAYPGAASTMCGDINNADVVVGGWADADGRLHGFVWRAGSFRSFDVPGAQDTLPLGINDAGDIVGEATFGGAYSDYAVPHKGFFTSSFH